MDLIADHISHRFGALEVLEDVSFTVRSGEVVAIVGPSGCGKSTLLSILGGLLQPGAGAAELRGAPPPGSFNPLTFVFQDFALLPWFTVEQNVKFALLHTDLAISERRAVVDDAGDRAENPAGSDAHDRNRQMVPKRARQRELVDCDRDRRWRRQKQIPLTRGERGDITARAKLLALQSELWSLIREQAIDAEREVQHA